MYLRLPHKQAGASRGLLQFAAAIGLMLPVALSVGCSGNHVAPTAASTPAPTITPAPALAITATLPPGTENSAYSGSLTVSGGTAPYIFSVASGQLPSGVLLGDSSGTVTGTPTTSGNFNFNVSVSDAKGATEEKSLQIAVATAATNSGGSSSGSGGSGSSGGSNGSTGNSNSGEASFLSLQHSGGWGQYGQQGPDYVDCSPSPCNGISFWMAQNVNNPSLRGQASEFDLGGSAPFSDGLWNNHLIGPGSTQGMPDSNGTIVPSLHNFT